MTDWIEDPFVRRVYDRLKHAGGAWEGHGELVKRGFRSHSLADAADTLLRSGLIRIAIEPGRRSLGARHYAAVDKFYRPDPPAGSELVKELTP